MTAPIGIELFAGCGGLSTGFLDAGLRVAAGFEIDRRAVDAYDYNHAHRGSHGFGADLAGAHGRDLLEFAKTRAVDFVIGGPPCQPFSIVGKRQGLADRRADLLAHYVRLIRELRPAVLLFENVPNLLNIEGGTVVDSLRSALERLGYAVSYRVLSAAEYGVPQNRKRFVLLGRRGDRQLDFPTATHGGDRKPYRTAGEALADLPDAAEFGACGIHNHEPTAHSADMVARFQTLQPGKRERGSFHDRLHPDRPSYTLRAGTGNFSPLRPIHFRYHRVVTVRESARIQGFSDDFIWPDRIPRLQQYRQVGNAVPPPLAAALAVTIAGQMGWRLDPKATRGDPADREPAMVMSDDERIALRRSRMRGASLGKLIAAE